MFFIVRAPIKKAFSRKYSNLYSAENVLSDENRKRTIQKFSSIKPIRLLPHEPVKKAAVLIPICVVNDKVSLLYTVRAPHMKSHRGQVSFPGGMQDICDDSLETTALRETYEELGLKPYLIDLWGRGTTIITKREMCVLPIVGFIKPKLKLNKLNINPQEVHEVFTVPLEDLCDPNLLGYTQFKGEYSAPVYLGGQRRIWGLTAIITNIFLKSLLPQKAYNHRIKFISAVPVNKHILPQ